MKHHPVIKALAGKRLDALHMIGRQIGTQADLHRPVLEFQNQIIGHYIFSLLRLMRAWATWVVVKGEMSPPSMAISLTSLEEIAWCRGSAIRNTVSISVLRRWFIATIWNSYSKSDTARRPRMIIEAPTSAANLTNRLSNG